MFTSKTRGPLISFSTCSILCVSCISLVAGGRRDRQLPHSLSFSAPFLTPAFRWKTLALLLPGEPINQSGSQEGIQKGRIYAP